MARIGFIGLGNMGLPMAQNLVKAGHSVLGFDVTSSALERATAVGVRANGDLAACVRDADLVLTMLPEGRHVRSAYLDEGGVLATVSAGALLVDCSTIDVESARAVSSAAAARGC